MKKYLPKTSKNPQGFTLVELLVVVAVIAILSAVGVTVFSGVQRQGRDAKRRTDVRAIAQALEQKSSSTGGYTGTLSSSDFAGNAVPAGTVANYNYCFRADTTAVGDISTGDTSCSGWTTLNSGSSIALSASNKYWKVCARLENDGVTAQQYCLGSTQL